MIPGNTFRIGIVGAASLAGKELADALAESPLATADVVLLDDEDAGRLTAAGDEAAYIQKLEPDAFAGLDFVFFAGDPARTKQYWKTARLAGASIVDMTYALEREPDVMVLGPWAGVAESREAGAQEPGLTTPAVIAAHPAALMLLLTANRLQAKLPVRSIAATVFEPASEHGRAAMDELHQQTVSLLSFQSVPREQFDAQVAFNLLPALGEAARYRLAEVRDRISEHYAVLAGARAPEPAVQVIQAPVFHGYVAALVVELEENATVEQLELAAYGEHVDVVAAESDPPSNVSAAGQSEILVRVSSAAKTAGPGKRFWMWLAADNLKVSALNAIACAGQLRRLRPQGKVQ